MDSSIQASLRDRPLLPIAYYWGCRWVACWRRGMLSWAKSKSTSRLIQRVLIKPGILFQNFFFGLGGPYSADLFAFLVSKGEVVSLVPFTSKFTERYRLCFFLAGAGVTVFGGRVGEKSISYWKIEGAKGAITTDWYYQKISAIFQNSNIYTRKHYLDSCTSRDSMFWEVFLVHYNGTICRAF
mgnify:FL=1